MIGDIVAVDGGLVDVVHEEEQSGTAAVTDTVAAGEGQRFIEVEGWDKLLVTADAGRSERCPFILGLGAVQALATPGRVGETAGGASGVDVGPAIGWRE